MVMVVVMVVEECTSSDYGGALSTRVTLNSQHTLLYSIRHVVSISPMAGDLNMFGQKDSCHHYQHYQYYQQYQQNH